MIFVINDSDSALVKQISIPNSFSTIKLEFELQN